MKNDSIRPPFAARRKRQASKQWRAIIMEACTDQNYAKIGFGYSELLAIASEHKVSINRDSLRVKINRYRRRGFLQNVKSRIDNSKLRGRFQVSQEGYGFFGALDSAN